MNTMKKIFLEGINSSKIQNRIKKINDLSDLEFSVFSQWEMMELSIGLSKI